MRPFFQNPFPGLGSLAPARELGETGDNMNYAKADIMYFLTNLNLVVPVVAAVTVIIIAAIVICVIRNRQNNLIKGELFIF